MPGGVSWQLVPARKLLSAWGKKKVVLPVSTFYPILSVLLPKIVHGISIDIEAKLCCFIYIIKSVLTVLQVLYNGHDKDGNDDYDSYELALFSIPVVLLIFSSS